MGGQPDLNAATEQQKAAAEVQAKSFNELVSGKPLEMAYIKDITADPASRTALVQGQTNADVMQKAGAMRLNPNQGLAGQSAVPVASVLSKAETNAGTNVNLQRLAGTMGLVKMGTGQASTAMTGMEGLAKQSTDKAINDAETSYQVHTATGNAIASGLSAAAYAGVKGLSTPTTNSSFLNSVKPAAGGLNMGDTTALYRPSTLTNMGF